MSKKNVKVTLSLDPDPDMDYLGLLMQLVEQSKKPGEKTNVSEYVRKLILDKAKKAGLL